MKMIHMDTDVIKQKANRDDKSDDGDIPLPIWVRWSFLSRNEAYGLIRGYYGYFLPGISIIFYVILLVASC